MFLVIDENMRLCLYISKVHLQHIFLFFAQRKRLSKSYFKKTVNCLIVNVGIKDVWQFIFELTKKIYVIVLWLMALVQQWNRLIIFKRNKVLSSMCSQYKYFKIIMLITHKTRLVKNSFKIAVTCLSVIVNNEACCDWQPCSKVPVYFSQNYCNVILLTLPTNMNWLWWHMIIM